MVRLKYTAKTIGKKNEEHGAVGRVYQMYRNGKRCGDEENLYGYRQ